jgi:hypothetical protein
MAPVGRATLETKEHPMRHLPLLVATLALGWVAIAVGNATAADDDQANKDLEAVRTYLEKNHAGKKWEAGPKAIDSDEVRTAYGKRRFVYVFSMPPTRPLRGARPSEEQERREAEEFQKAVAKFEKERVSMTVGLDGDGKVTPYPRPADFNQGLMPVKSDADAKVAAAAILSLYVADPYGQRTVAAREVMLQPQKSGWHCEVSREKENWRGVVLFDAAGKCLGVSRHYAGPLPP